MNAASANQSSQQNAIVDEIKNRVLEIDALRHGNKHPEHIDLPLDYIEALDEITVLDRQEIEEIARSVIAKHKNIVRPTANKKKNKTKERGINEWLINISFILVFSVFVKVVFLTDDTPRDPNEKSLFTRIASYDYKGTSESVSNTVSSAFTSVKSLIPESPQDEPLLANEETEAQIQNIVQQVITKEESVAIVIDAEQVNSLAFEDARELLTKQSETYTQPSSESLENDQISQTQLIASIDDTIADELVVVATDTDINQQTTDIMTTDQIDTDSSITSTATVSEAALFTQADVNLSNSIDSVSVETVLEPTQEVSAELIAEPLIAEPLIAKEVTSTEAASVSKKDLQIENDTSEFASAQATNDIVQESTSITAAVSTIATSDVANFNVTTIEVTDTDVLGAEMTGAESITSELAQIDIDTAPSNSAETNAIEASSIETKTPESIIIAAETVTTTPAELATIKAVENEEPSFFEQLKQAYNEFMADEPEVEIAQNETSLSHSEVNIEALEIELSAIVADDETSIKTIDSDTVNSKIATSIVASTEAEVPEATAPTDVVISEQLIAEVISSDELNTIESSSDESGFVESSSLENNSDKIASIDPRPAEVNVSEVAIPEDITLDMTAQANSSSNQVEPSVEEIIEQQTEEVVELAQVQSNPTDPTETVELDTSIIGANDIAQVNRTNDADVISAEAEVSQALTPQLEQEQISQLATDSITNSSTITSTTSTSEPAITSVNSELEAQPELTASLENSNDVSTTHALGNDSTISADDEMLAILSPSAEELIINQASNEEIALLEAHQVANNQVANDSQQKLPDPSAEYEAEITSDIMQARLAPEDNIDDVTETIIASALEKEPAPALTPEINQTESALVATSNTKPELTQAYAPISTAPPEVEQQTAAVVAQVADNHLTEAKESDIEQSVSENISVSNTETMVAMTPTTTASQETQEQFLDDVLAIETASINATDNEQLQPILLEQPNNEQQFSQVPQTDDEVIAKDMTDQLAAIVELTQLAKMSVSEFYMQQSRLPTPDDQIVLPVNYFRAHPMITGIHLAENSELIVKLEDEFGMGTQVTLTPSISSTGSFVNWHCGTNVNPNIIARPNDSNCEFSTNIKAASAVTSDNRNTSLK
ncbi:hypothetical protein [Shewanella maritima]|uniref:hypothetical protein n=1 Tax=Shewanella maritima TaxID=2520507 RepID=UPI003735535D